MSNEKKVETLLPPHERQARTREKRDRVLKFLRTEIWTHGDVIADLLGFKSRQAGHKTLSTMARDGLLKQAKIETSYGRPIALYGITDHGQALAWGLDEAMPAHVRVFEPSKIKPTTMAHHLDIQKMRIRAERAGWTDWQQGDAVFKKEPKMKYPDAIALSPTKGVRVAIEVERTIKSRKRYMEVIVAHLLARRAGHYEQVLYLCPDEDLAARLARVLDNIKTVNYGGKSVPLTEDHRQIFVVQSYDGDWPSM